MDVQNKLALVEQRLPEQVRRQGIPVQKANSGFLLLIAVGSNSGRTGALELGNFANARVVDELRRVPGVGNVQVFASPYALRIWLDPQKLDNYRLSPAEAQIGRASCRDRVCTYVYISVVDASYKTNKP